MCAIETHSGPGTPQPKPLRIQVVDVVILPPTFEPLCQRDDIESLAFCVLDHLMETRESFGSRPGIEMCTDKQPSFCCGTGVDLGLQFSKCNGTIRIMLIKSNARNRPAVIRYDSRFVDSLGNRNTSCPTSLPTR